MGSFLEMKRHEMRASVKGYSFRMCFRHDEKCMMYCPFHGYDLIFFSGYGWACPAEKCAIKIKDEADVCKFMGKLHKTLHPLLSWEWPVKCHCGEESRLVKKRGRKTSDGRKINTRFYFSCDNNQCCFYQPLNEEMREENRYKPIEKQTLYEGVMEENGDGPIGE